VLFLAERIALLFGAAVVLAVMEARRDPPHISCRSGGRSIS
jgi:hypothetical protein